MFADSFDISEDKFYQFIKDNANADCSRLRLKYTDDWQRFAISQIEARKKTKSKLVSFVSNEKFLFPTTLLAEQSTNETIAKFHSSLFSGSDSVVDLTAGLCIDSFFISKIVQKVVAVEIDEFTAKINKLNMESLNGKVEIVNANAEQYVSYMPKFNAAFIDPARRDINHNRVYSLNDCSPNLGKILPFLKDKVDFIVVKASPLLNISQIVSQFPNCCDFWAVSVKNECKEVLFKIDLRKETITPVLHAVNFEGNVCQFLSYPFLNDSIISKLECISEGMYLYEPNSSIMKFGLFDAIINKFPSLIKISKNSHLFISNEVITDFDGRTFFIEEIVPYKNKKIKEIQKRFPKINIATRNFPVTANELKKRLKVIDGGESYLFATTLPDKHAILIICKKM